MRLFHENKHEIEKKFKKNIYYSIHMYYCKDISKIDTTVHMYYCVM